MDTLAAVAGLLSGLQVVTRWGVAAGDTPHPSPRGHTRSALPALTPTPSKFQGEIQTPDLVGAPVPALGQDFSGPGRETVRVRGAWRRGETGAWIQ